MGVLKDDNGGIGVAQSIPCMLVGLPASANEHELLERLGSLGIQPLHLQVFAFRTFTLRDGQASLQSVCLGAAQIELARSDLRKADKAVQEVRYQARDRGPTPPAPYLGATPCGTCFTAQCPWLMVLNPSSHSSSAGVQWASPAVRHLASI